MKENAALLIMKDKDNIGIAVRKIDKGETISDPERRLSIQAREEIPFGFKVAIRNIEQDAVVYKYGEPIGKATRPIACGELVHVHNIVGLRGRGVFERQNRAGHGKPDGLSGLWKSGRKMDERYLYRVPPGERDGWNP